MSKSIDSIIWPKDSDEAIKKYITFMLSVCDSFNISFSNGPHNPIRLSSDFIKGNVGFDALNDASLYWWDVVDQNGIRDFTDSDVLKARIALCFLALKENAYPELGEHLSWFIEVLGFAGYDVDKALEIYDTFFDFE
ncbi:hypothetical protein N5923_08875 [Erwiniaceae bacterium BAC15a-03b]|uniref:Uncharacterized protein n=1 Tax=Winslowiella arboricola TaxID=2978220 RepID=A0A9J6PMF4_9GAMM|nr:hypothetical protein [Winslowiella arboricola]MCU5771726.1 hypothetical protein [Winslowiella arboricola]MCU5777603.1 hypothetical protein [Winslowiella arboricola]